MSYHKLPNLGQAFQEDLIKNVISEDFADLLCNCNNASKGNGEYMFGGDCLKSVVLYNAEYKQCQMIYIGNTQQKVNLQTTQQLGEICNLVIKVETSDSFAKHFTYHFKDKLNLLLHLSNLKSLLRNK